MRTIFLRAFFAVFFFALFGIGALAQDKTQAYYNNHEREILPDARTAFRNGRYDRAVELCRWHYIFVGNNDADALRDQANRCGELSRSMAEMRADGNMREAREMANTLLSINPDDTAAKQLLKELDALEKAIEPELKPEPKPVFVDTVAAPISSERMDAIVEEKPTEKLEERQADVVIKEDIPDSYRPVTPTQAVQKPKSPETPHTRFVAKVDAVLLDMKQIVPGASIGLYDLGGSLIGLEAGAYFSSSLAEKTASVFGMDASVAFRVGKGMYPKLGAGFFSCKSNLTGTGTKGLCAGLGVTFLIGGNFCVEVGAKYYPKVNVSGTETVSTAGTTYEFPKTVQIIAGGIAPVVSLGWSF